jgi:hypothetical protein
LDAFKERQDDMRSLAVAELGFGAALVEDSRVVGLLVAIGEFLENLFHFAVAVVGGGSELVGDGEAQEAQGKLMVRIDCEDVPADGFGFFGFIEVTVQFGFGDGLGDAGF